MSLLDLFTSGEHKKAKSYFAALVKLAFADGILETSELKFLQKMAIKLDIEDAEFAKILKFPERYPLDPPLEYNDRIEVLYYFVGMIFASHDITDKEMTVVEKLAIGLGFPTKNAEAITLQAVVLVRMKSNFETFSQKIKKLNI